MKRDAIQFKPLRESDSLVARINQIWNLKPSLVRFEYEDYHYDTGAYRPEICHLTREQAARELRRLRRLRKATVEIKKREDGPGGYVCSIEIPKGCSYGRWD